MSGDAFKSLDDDALRERFRGLILAYDEACATYHHARAAEIHREFYQIEDELRRRRGDADWRRTGLEELGVDDVIVSFRERAIAYDEADGTDETEHLYSDLDAAKKELQRRPGDQRRALFALYFDPDIRVRAAAAEATRNLAPLLSLHRLRNIDDEEWQAPISGVDIEEADLAAFFPARTGKPRRLAACSADDLRQRFAAIALQQSDAQLGAEIARYNRLFWQTKGIEEELKGRTEDQRKVLVPLLQHPNPQVRLMAAQCTLAVAPDESRKTLQALWDQKLYPQAMYAKGTLDALERGERKPT
jgi:hypothetical protein